jgi:hypothetical protein
VEGRRIVNYVKEIEKKRRKKSTKEELGYASFYCEGCEKEFDVSWYDIFSMQEGTHGYVSYFIEQEYIGCPKCGENVNETNHEGNPKQPSDCIPDDKLPF